MKNNECTIYITTNHGYIQRYHKEKNGWTQINPNGKVRLLSAEQLLSHILPSLAGIGSFSVRVEPDKQKKDRVGRKVRCIARVVTVTMCQYYERNGSG